MLLFVDCIEKYQVVVACDFNSYVYHVPTEKKKVLTCTVGPPSSRLCGNGVVQVTQDHQEVAPVYR